MKVFINYSDNIIDINISEDFSIQALKEKLRDILHIEPEDQFYFFKGGILRDQMKLSDYNINEGNIISLYTYLPKKKKIEICFRTLTGKTFTINVEPSAKIIDIKFMIEKQKLYNIGKQRLICGGIGLDDNKTLADYNLNNIDKNSFIVFDYKFND